jgi:adenylate kinase family enzyme
MKKGTLIFFCAKMGSGKTTNSINIALERNAVLLSEDEWLESIYPKKITSLNDYIKYSTLLKPQMKKLVHSILNTGTDVVMDFPANTTSQREWFKSIFLEVKAPHSLIYIDVSNELCLKRIEKRRKEQPERSATDTVEMFEQVTKYFVEPSKDEGFNIKKVR